MNKNKYTKPTKEAIAQALKIPNLTLLERVVAAEIIEESWAILEAIDQK